jgi:hypothetical protein
VFCAKESLWLFEVLAPIRPSNLFRESHLFQFAPLILQRNFRAFDLLRRDFFSAVRVFLPSSWRPHDLPLAARPPKEVMPLGLPTLLVPMALGQATQLPLPCRLALVLLQVRRRNFRSFSVEEIRSFSLMVLWTFIHIFFVLSKKLYLFIDFLERDRGNFDFCFKIPATVRGSLIKSEELLPKKNLLTSWVFCNNLWISLSLYPLFL